MSGADEIIAAIDRGVRDIVDAIGALEAAIVACEPGPPEGLGDGLRKRIGRLTPLIEQALTRSEPRAPAPTGERFIVSRLVCPCIYIWRRGGLVLYVGESRLGAVRAFKSDRKHGKPWTIEPTDEVEILWRPGATKEQLLAEEARLIRELRPIWNTAGMALAASTEQP